jgi:hypothetical protein
VRATTKPISDRFLACRKIVHLLLLITPHIRNSSKLLVSVSSDELPPCCESYASMVPLLHLLLHISLVRSVGRPRRWERREGSRGRRVLSRLSPTKNEYWCPERSRGEMNGERPLLTIGHKERDEEGSGHDRNREPHGCPVSVSHRVGGRGLVRTWNLRVLILLCSYQPRGGGGGPSIGKRKSWKVCWLVNLLIMSSATTG